jgi:hypothetical protein
MQRGSGEGNKPRRSIRYGAWPAAIAGIVVACGGEPAREPPKPRSIVTDVILVVDNRTPDARWIYLRSGNQADSLGEVPHRSARSFSLPSSASDSTTALQLEARSRRAVAGVRSPAFHLSSGHQVVWTLEPSDAARLTMR